MFETFLTFFVYLLSVKIDENNYSRLGVLLTLDVTRNLSGRLSSG